MTTGYCPKCKNSCEITFVSYITKKDGKKVFPKKGKKCLVIPHCTNCK